MLLIILLFLYSIDGYSYQLYQTDIEVCDEVICNEDYFFLKLFCFVAK